MFVVKDLTPRETSCVCH